VAATLFDTIAIRDTIAIWLDGRLPDLRALLIAQHRWSWSSERVNLPDSVKVASA